MCELLSSRNLLRAIADLPKVGFIALKNDHAIGAIFLRHIEGNFGLIDGLITHPLESSSDRNLAISKVVDSVIDHAKNEGLTSMLAYSLDIGTLERSKSYNFRKIDHTLMALDLKESL